MEWLALLTGAFKAIPVLSQDIKDVLSYLKRAEAAGWFNKTANDFQVLSGPTTGEQKDAAAKAIANDISKL